MLMKRHYRLPDGWHGEYDDAGNCLKTPLKRVDAQGNCINPPPFDYIEVKHTGTDAEQHFSARLVNQGIAEGWISIGGGKLVLHAKPEDLVYAIERVPGRWCVHCRAKLPDDVTGAAARAHVAANHAGQVSPDSRYPAGYACPAHYKVRLDAQQHERLKARQASGAEVKHG